jgi:hypothetical protein
MDHGSSERGCASPRPTKRPSLPCLQPSPPAATMAAATKLNPFAAPFHCPYPYAYVLHLAPPAPPPFPLADACPPRFPFVTYCVAASPEGRFGFCFPVQQPSASPAVLRKGVLAAPPHGLPPHKLMAAFSRPCGAGKRHAAEPVPVKPVAAAVAAPAQVPAAEGGEQGAAATEGCGSARAPGRAA